MQPWVLGLLIFGGNDPETNFIVTDNSFEIGFLREACLSAWAAIGMAPLVCKCLDSPQVACQLEDDDYYDTINQLILLMDAANEMVCYHFSRHDYDGSTFCVFSKTVV